MGTYKQIRELWKSPKKNLSELWKQRLIAWRKEPVTVRLERPTRLDRARSLGYRAKEGIFIVRQRVKRGGHTRDTTTRRGRRPKHYRQKMVLGKSYQTISEERAARKYVNCEVLNSYKVAEDGKHYWFEIIMVDIAHPAIKKDKKLNWLMANEHTRRVFRGLTGSSRRSRGLTKKGKGAEKIRPSQRARKRLAK
jgi:large subunit ribosomal protein L15e